MSLNDELTIFLGLLGISSTMLSVLTAILFIRLSDHLATMRKLRLDVVSQLEGFSSHIKSFIDNIDYVTQGQQLGILGGTPSYNPHIHIGFFYNYNGSSNVSMLNVLTMEGLKLDEYVATCRNGNWFEPNRYFPSTQ